MDKNIAFSYQYSAAENKEVQEIRKKYLPQEENKLEELKRLDHEVQMSGMTESLCLGILSSLVFGLGLCLAMHIIGESTMFVFLGIVLGMAGTVDMLLAYPVQRSIFLKTKEELAPRILQLASELSGEKDKF